MKVLIMKDYTHKKVKINGTNHWYPIDDLTEGELICYGTKFSGLTPGSYDEIIPYTVTEVKQMQKKSIHRFFNN